LGFVLKAFKYHLTAQPSNMAVMLKMTDSDEGFLFTPARSISIFICKTDRYTISIHLFSLAR
jgi:hypothetical protein